MPGLESTLLSSFTRGASVTPNDGADLSRPAHALYIGTSGNLRVTTIGGDELTFTNVPVGIFDVQVKKVFNTNTTAAGIFALYRS